MAVDRGHAQPGQTVRLRAAFSLAGTPVDPYQIRQVEILDENMAVLATISGTSIVRAALGQYYVDWFVPSNEPVTIHFDRWFATASSGGVEEAFTFAFQVLAFSTATAGTPYMTVESARTWLPDASEITAEQLAQMVLLGQETIEWVTGQTFMPQTSARIFDGSGRGTLSIKRPIQSVIEARVLSCHPGGEDSLIDPAGIRISGSRTMLALGNVQRYSDRFASGFIGYPWGWPGGGCGIWPPGFQNVQITGEWGAFASPPRQITAALGQLIRYAAVCDDPLGLTDAAFSSESTDGDRQYTMRDIFRKAQINNATGYADVDSILARFRQGVIVGSV